MKITFTDEQYDVPEIYQFDDIRYSKALSCDCGEADYTRTNSYKLVGFCSTSHGYMIVCECMQCHDKYRHHAGFSANYDIEVFKKDIGLILHLQRNLS